MAEANGEGIKDTKDNKDTKDARRNPCCPSLRSLVSLVSLIAACLLYGCQGDIEETAAAMTGGSPARGKEVIRRYGCEACHSIPGVAGARGQVGPPLDGIANRTYLAGQLNNTPENLIRWIRDPQGIQPGTAMPETRRHRAGRQGHRRLPLHPPLGRDLAPEMPPRPRKMPLVPRLTPSASGKMPRIPR